MCPRSIVAVHPTAVRRPYNIVVQSGNTTYTDSHIAVKFVNRGANVQVVNGQYFVTPTIQPYEFQTATNISKSGSVSSRSSYFFFF
jgi:myo-inositol-1-phosphate synthase